MQTINGLLSSIPFTAKSNDTLTYFLNVYKLNYRALMKLNEQSFKFPIESSKVLKLSISLGNLLKTLHNDEENYLEQSQSQRSFLTNLQNSSSNNVNNNNHHSNNNINTNSHQDYNPFNVASPVSPKHIINSPISAISGGVGTAGGAGSTGPGVQPLYQIKFVSNLLSILKNFDIGTPTNVVNSGSSQHSDLNSVNLKLHEMTSSNSTSTLTSHTTNGTASSSNASPIKLNSKQLLIEKLEINIKLDNLFIYRVLLQLLLQILSTLQGFIAVAAENASHSSGILASPASSGSSNDYAENSSIFSSNSLRSSESRNSAMTIDECIRTVQSIVARVSTGIVEPFIRLLIVELVENNVSRDFNKLVNSL
ncbi:predicted protein [Scheffersomyces stipitis CBS 6054]|uniref:Uncharacterized protein n=1 Tax=Scheffersomyces stipitis (strain ATCC 58785 / CBS 6054 / NBRC 10063 / NRRL Y-11545) TaxID=322104 RepID=A3LXR7_PICST|nr:predicted protein [Scheffersomyces stipitis CBS 6054]ABN67512.2 predicted protein [Scheffersomyces stipitis CBS 6054]